MHRWIVGIDEAGRGPLAGPVAVGAVGRFFAAGFAVVDVPAAALEVDGGAAQLSGNLGAVTTRTVGNRCVRKRGQLFKVNTTTLADIFVDRHNLTPDSIV